MGVELAGLAVLAGVSIYEGEQARRQQKAALANQEKVQRDQQAQAQALQQRNERDLAKAKSKTPDVGSLLNDATSLANTGPGSTMLSGSFGVLANQGMLGRSSLLGN